MGSVVIIGPAYPLRGGLASYNERLAREFQHKGWQTAIYTFSLQYPSILFPGKTQYSSDPAPTDLNIQEAINSVNPLNWIKVGNALKKLKPDIIIVRYWLPFMGPCLGTILRRVKKNKHTRVICIADNIIPHEKRVGDAAFTKYFIKPIDGFITMSEKVLADVRDLDNKKPSTFVAHPLYDNFGEPILQSIARNHLGIPENTPLILFFGFIRKYKGLDILFDAIKMVESKVPEKSIRVLIAGEFYEDSAPYLAQIKQLGITDSVILKTTFIPDSEVKYYLCAADVVVQPYRNATQSGVTPLAYHFEKPMIVTNVGGLTAMVPDEKVGLIAAPNAADIAEKIISFFNYPPNHFLQGIQQEKTKYSWSVMVDAIVEMAENIR